MREVHEIDQLVSFLEREHHFIDCVVQGLDLGEIEVDWSKVKLSGSVFLGCRFPSLAYQERLREGGALIFPRLPGIPYNPYRPTLYTRDELTEGWSEERDQSLDWQIYEHFVNHGRHKPNLLESLCQRLHDHAIDDGLSDLLEGRVEGDGAKKVVAIMGGHGTSRTDSYFRKVIEISRELTRRGYFIASGGDPGIMEAANLSAWISNAPDDFLERAFEELAKAPVYSDEGFHETAATVPNGTLREPQVLRSRPGSTGMSRATGSRHTSPSISATDFARTGSSRLRNTASSMLRAASARRRKFSWMRPGITMEPSTLSVR